MLDPVADFRRWLERNDKRLTRERSIIVKAVFALNAPILTDELLESLARSGEPYRVSRATVYRTMIFLEEARLLVCSSPHDDPELRQYSAVRPTVNPVLCATEHARLISGRCPWCGSFIVDGNCQTG
jgi:Fe2+ or Zn2+ uptake regulation protein